jgi:hypothetical protein
MDPMLNNMLCSEFVEWQNFAMLEPFGAKFDEIHMAGIRAQIANYLRKPNSTGYKASDFMITQTKKCEQSVAEIYQLFGGSN